MATPSSSFSSSASCITDQELISRSNSTSSPVVFTLFSFLPIELRQSIWAHSIDAIGPRIVPLEPDDAFEDMGWGFRCWARIGTPTLLHVCSEARKESLRVYSLKFYAQLRHPVYFDKTRDTLLMSKTRSMYSFLQSTFNQERITHNQLQRDEVFSIAMLINDSDLNCWSEDDLHGYPSWRQVSTAARAFGNLKELKLIYRAECDRYSLGFHAEKRALEGLWSNHWFIGQEKRALAMGNRNTVPLVCRLPELVFWSREELLVNLSTVAGVVVTADFNGRGRGWSEPLLARLWGILYS